eukprot:4129242-Amphidinium_carterae.1
MKHLPSVTEASLQNNEFLQQTLSASLVDRPYFWSILLLEGVRKGGFRRCETFQMASWILIHTDAMLTGRAP